ncbi:hypothetical protein Glove_13g106 [Diversispora epigaea]|uniref:Uncharacterized protein n=1 Tax=Diversispora epigaea TaxID=1348612 RepID=A0A397JRY1_9GLOM|nr:hypothetical protein Glove_13g106 [Diversispora epigaea]
MTNDKLNENLSNDFVNLLENEDEPNILLEFTAQLVDFWDKCLVPQYERDEFFGNIQKFTAQLVDFWDKCLVPQYERDEFFGNIQKPPNLLTKYVKLLSQEVSHLQELYAECVNIYRWTLESRALIET